MKSFFKYYLSFVIVFCVCWNNLSAQESDKINWDSTFLAINKLRLTNPDSALVLCNELLDILDKSENIEARILLHQYFFYIYHYAKKDVKSSLQHLHTSKFLAEKTNSKKLPTIYQNLGRFHHRSTNQLDSALYYFFAAIRVSPSEGHEYALSHYHSDLAMLYISLNDAEKATIYIEKALDFLRKNGKRMDYGYALSLAKDIYGMKPDSVKLKLLELEYQTFKSGKEKSSVIAHQLSSYDPNGKSKKEFLSQSIVVEEKNKNLIPLLTNRLELASQLIKDKQFDEAITVLKEGLIHINDSTLMWKLDYYMKLKQLYLLKSNYKEALAISDTLANVNNKLMDETKVESVKEMEAKYQKLENEQKIQILEREKAISSKNYYILSLLLSLAAILAIAMFLLFRQKRKNYNELSSKNDIITTMLAEKDLLIKEIHHRVKNNLQIVSSLLQLQSNYIHDDAALEAINDGKNRVSSMALIHQNLYTEEHLNAIETMHYFDHLLDQIFDSYNIEESQISLDKSIDSLLLDVDTMIPLGLITNELITNSLKHAFPNRMSGKINFMLKDEGDHITLKITDNGVGVSLEEFNTSKSFGNKMIQAFVKKMKADFIISNEHGTEIKLVVKKAKDLLKAAS
jgi:two-component sensor histidine kinase